MHMRHLTILLSILILAQNSAAANVAAIPLGAYVIYKDVPAPYDGVLLSNKLAEEIFQDLHQLDLQKEANVSLLKSLSLMQENEGIYKSEITELKDQNVKLDTALVKANTNGFWNHVMYFGLGIVTTGLIVYATRH